MRFLPILLTSALLTAGCDFNGVVGGQDVPDRQTASGTNDNVATGSRAPSDTRILALFDRCAQATPPFETLAQPLIDTEGFRPVSALASASREENILFRHGQGPSGQFCKVEAISPARPDAIARLMTRRYGSPTRRDDGALLFRGGEIIYWTTTPAAPGPVMHNLFRRP